MAEDSLDIYIRSLVLEATRLECKKITVVQGEGRPKITFVAPEESLAFPHPPKEKPDQLVPRLRALAGLSEAAAGEEKAVATINRRDGNIELGLTFKSEGGETHVDIEVLSNVVITHM